MTDSGFSTNNYWSSTENNSNNAWNLNFNNGSWNNNNKNNNNYVRCVRSKTSATSLFQPQGPITLHEVFDAYFDCRRAKRNTDEQLNFEISLEKNLIDLYDDIRGRNYRPGPSIVFVVLHPKPREVWAAQFRDRVVHHIIYKRLAPTYHRLFIADTYACIPGRGVHAGVQKAEHYARQLTSNYQRDAWYIKADVANFFCSIDRRTLWQQIEHTLVDDDIFSLVHQILTADLRESAILRSSPERMAKVPFHKSLWNAPANKGLPIGNLTSQFFANVYLDEMDRYAKRTIGFPRYVRYVDDIIVFDNDLDFLRDGIGNVDAYIQKHLSLSFHPQKTIHGRIKQGFDFLGFYCLPGRRYLRRSTRHRIEYKVQQRFAQFANHEISAKAFEQSIASLLGVCSQANQFPYIRKTKADFFDANLICR